MSGRVLVVEDDTLTGTMVRVNLEAAGYEVALVTTGTRGLAAASERPFDVIVLDYMLPGQDGLEVLAGLRAQSVGTPVLMLTARDETPLKVEALDLGADDYLTKPFHVDELLARLRALVRRSQSRLEKPAHGRLVVGQLTVDVGARLAHLPSGEPVNLGEKECALLELFAREPRVVFSRADILDEVWGMDANPVERTVDNYILALRRLVEPDPESPRFLLTVRGRGYQYVPEAP